MGGELRLLDLLEVLARHEVEFLVVGGVAASLLGSPLSTQDLDILYNPHPESHPRLLSALRELEARYYDPAGRHIVPDAERLETLRIHLLLTKHGRLDLLRHVGDELTYADLIDETEEYAVRNFRIRALNLETLIRVKEMTDRPKDRLALLYLRKIRGLGDRGPDT